MAYLSTTKTLTHTQYGAYDDFKEVYSTFTYDITVAPDGTASFTITHTHNGKEKVDKNNIVISLWIEINGEEVVPAKYYNSSSVYSQNTLITEVSDKFPLRSGSYIKGNLKNKITAKSFSIKSKILPGSGYNSTDDHTNKWNARLSTSTFTRTEAGGYGTLTTVDNGNNKVKFTGRLPNHATENAFIDAIIYYTVDGTEPTEASSRIELQEAAGSSFELYRKIDEKVEQFRSKLFCYFDYNTAITSAADIVAAYRVSPYFGTDAMVSITGQHTRLVPKDSWDFSWSTAQAGNADSPIEGYDVKIEVKKQNSDDYETLSDWIYHEEADSLVMDYVGYVPSLAQEDGAIRTDSTYTKLTMEYPQTEFEIEPGDKIKVSVRAYTPFGEDPALTSSYISSAEYEVKNAAIASLKTQDRWVEGQVFIKDNGSWHEADSVYIKSASGWLESQ